MLRSYAERFSWPFKSVWERFGKSRQIVNKEQQVEQSVINVCLQTLFTWKNKTHSSLAVALTYIALWFFYWALKTPFYVGSSVALLWLLHDLWFNYVWPEIRVPTAEHHPRMIPKVRIGLGNELSTQLNDIVQSLVQVVDWARQIREDNHLLFCIGLSSILIGAAVIGHIVPGLIFAHIIFISTWLTSCGMKFPSRIFAKPGVDFEDLVPDLSGDELQVLQSARDASALPGVCSDTSFLDLPSIPTIDEIELTLRNTPENDLNFVPEHFDYQDLSPGDSVNDFIHSSLVELEPESTTLPQQIMNLAEGVISRGRVALGFLTDPLSDSGTEDFEILSHSDLDQ